MKTLKDTISYKDDEGNVIVKPTSEMVAQAVKSLKVKPLKDDEGNEIMQPKDIVKNVLLGNFRTKEGESYELPDEMSDYEKLNDYCATIVEADRDAEKGLKDAKEAEKQQKAQERQAQKEIKEKEDAEYSKAGGEFEDIFLKRAAKLDSKRNEQVSAMLLTVGKMLPSSAALANSGLGVTLGDNASRADIAQATAAVVNGLEGIASMQGALQFSLGDLINGAVRNKAYRTKADACSAIKMVVKDKLQKNFNIGTLNYYASMAERVTLENRKVGVNASLYLEASKLTPPRLKDSKPSDAIKLEEECVEARNEIISKINSGEIKSIKDAKSQIEEFKASKGFGKKEVTSMSKVYNDLFYARFIKEKLLGDADEITVQIDTKNTKTYTRGELTDIEEDAMNQLMLMKIKQKLENLIAGFVTKGKGDKAEKVPYLLNNPFGVETDGVAPAEKEEEPEEAADDDDSDDDNDE